MLKDFACLEHGQRTICPVSEPSPTAKTYTIAGVSVQTPPLAPGLYLVSTPIGNLRDISLRALETLAAADLVLCEDTRLSARLLDHYLIRTRRQALHEHNETACIPALI
ncbi:MAG: hypothetical protein KKH72_09650, partial [Alphaproteobacteria bacterium]|nr:hypothetical protein [Alphaproteobacteria bacterium]